MAEWEKRVRSSIKEASKLKHPILIDTLPAFLDNIAEAVSDTYPRTDAIDSTSLASEHGGERARLTSYDPQALMRFPRYFVHQRVDFMQPVFPDFVRFSSDPDTELANNSQALNADGFDYKRLQYIRSWQPSFQHG